MNELDEMKVLFRALIDAEREEQKAKHRALGLDASDLRAFSNIHRAQRGDKVTLPTAPVAKAADEPRGSGWIDPQPLKPPPGIEIIDRMIDAQDRKDNLDALIAERDRLLAERKP
jgi:hypothetical protein